jgi:hypothetical protein
VSSTPATARAQDTGTEPAPPRGHAYGLLTFAVILLATFGLFNAFDGMIAIFKSHVFTENAHYVVGSLRTWGWVVMLLGILQMVAAVAIAGGRAWARWFGIVVLAVNALGQLMFLPAYPMWSVILVAVDVLALYALAVYGGSRLSDETPTGSGTWTRSAGPVARPPA